MRPNEDNPPRFHEDLEMNPNGDPMLQLYEAALKDSVVTFNTLIRNDPLILHKVSLTSFTETPLHISALAGHLEFTEAMLIAKPELASRLDSLSRSPLHLASAEGHVQIIKALLSANLDVCLVADEEERIPLHLAVMRGHVEVVQELIDAQPNSVLVKLKGDTVLHLAVKYNRLKALKQVMTQLNENEVFDSTDQLGNTILHLAVMLKQSETIRYLVSVSEVKGKINALSSMGFGALDLLEHYPKDFKGHEIGDILFKAGSRRRSTDENPNPPNTIPTQSQLVPAAGGGETQVKAAKWGFSSLGLNERTNLLYRKFMSCFKHRSGWVEKMQGTLMLVATLTATISFQVAISPPGGVWAQDYTNVTVGAYNCKVDCGKCVAGNAVLAYVYPNGYLLLIIFAIMSFLCISDCCPFSDQRSSSQEQGMYAAYDSSYGHCNYVRVSYLRYGDCACDPCSYLFYYCQGNDCYTIYLDGFAWNCYCLWRDSPSLLARQSSAQVKPLVKAITSVQRD